MKEMVTHFSNRVEVLFEQLAHSLFSDGSDPFSRRIIIVPTLAMKNWLAVKLADEGRCGVAAGIEVTTLERAILLLCHHFESLHLLPHTPHFPTELELSLLFETEISEQLDNPKSPQEWGPLKSYLRGQPQRLSPLCERMAMLFMLYGHYGCQMLNEWEALESPPTCWQEAIWRSLKCKHPKLSFPLQLLFPVAEKLKEVAVGAIFPQQQWRLHLFAVSHLCKSVDSFFCLLAEKFPTRYYMLSPCQRFWSELCSDRESVKLQRYWQRRGASPLQQSALEDFLLESNAILANFGRLGREMALQVEEHYCQSFEQYFLPSSVRSHPDYAALCEEEYPNEVSGASLTLLEALQADMLLLRTATDCEKIDLSPEALTLQIHNAPTPYREIEVLYNTILNLLTTHANDSLAVTAEDIVVMAPDLSPYVPYIEAIFKGSETAIDLQYIGADLPFESSLVQGFFHLIALAESRWEVQDLLNLLECTSFQGQHHLSHSDVEQIRHWTLRCATSWGSSPEHRRNLLRRHYTFERLVDDNPAGSWEHTLGRLLMGFAVEPLALKGTIVDCTYPYEEIDSSSAELLGRWISILEKLKESLRPISENMCKDLPEWEHYFKRLLDENFIAEEGGGANSLLGYKELSHHFTIMGKASTLLGQQSIAFRSLRSYLDKFQREGSSRREQIPLRGVRFGTLYSLRAIPAKVVVLIGMNESSFPRLEQQSSLNEMRGRSDIDYCPTQNDYDRYLFLEALLSARHYLIASFVGYSFSEEKPAASSILLQELSQYVDEHFSIDGKPPSHYLIKNHRLDAFDNSYFSSDSSLPSSYSRFHYQLAVSDVKSVKSVPHLFIPNLGSRTPLSKDLRQNVFEGGSTAAEHLFEIKELALLASNPLKFYFRKALKIKLPDSSCCKKESSEPFLLDPLQKYKLRTQMVGEGIDSLVDRASKIGVFPFGMFKHLAADALFRDWDQMHAHFSILRVDPKEMFNLHFSTEYQTPTQADGGHWYLPAIDLQSESVVGFKIIGTLPEVTPQGMIVHSAFESSHIVKLWPLWLIFQHAIEKYKLPIMPKIISSREAKALEPLSGGVENALHCYITYYFAASLSPAPLLPDFICELLHPDSAAFAETLRRSLEDPFFNNNNIYLRWLFREPKQLEAVANWHASWQELAATLFAPLPQLCSTKRPSSEKVRLAVG